jgi:PadR family transcriptional regulator AphA
VTSPKASTTTYTLLALLALRPWTGYELTRQAQRSLRYAWPRSEAHLYSEQERLVRLGWATMTKEARGSRTRNRYTITATGRRALREWMRTTPEGPRLEIEGVVRIFFADQGDVNDLVAAVRATGAQARVGIEEFCDFAEEYFRTGGPFPERLELIAMAADLVSELLARIESFSQEAVEEIERWDTTSDRGMTPEAAARFRNILARGGRAVPEA